MPRQARIKRKSGIYHIMLRGINQQQIFEDTEDQLKFLSILQEYKEISGFQIFAYCFMSNHIHILLKEEQEELQQIMKRIAGKYVYWYNGKYKRVGHLFQDRFKSEPVQDEKYLLMVLRYIHQNPVKSNLVKHVAEYDFSSYQEYINDAFIVDTDFVMNIISLEDFICFHQQLNEDYCMEMTEKPFRVTDEEAKMIIKKLSRCDTISEFQNIDIQKRNELLQQFKARGLSVRQINRLTGISKGVIERMVK